MGAVYLAHEQANCNGAYPYGTVVTGHNLRRTCVVGSFGPNAWGLCDMHGNVAERSKDWYHKDYYRVGKCRDPKGPRTGPGRVLRGGSWYDEAQDCRAARRFCGVAMSLGDLVGFRVCLHENHRRFAFFSRLFA
jgi:formylglycine-generating enzyme required for sulfatase activity